MPSSATITAFYSFSANTRARASLINYNFSNFRGTLVPIDPNTQTATDITYDLGSDQHRWRYGYFGTVDFDRSTSTASATFAADQNTSTGEVVIALDGSEKGRFTSKGFLGVRDVRSTLTAAQNQLSISTGILSGVYNLSNTSVAVSGMTCTIISNGGPVIYEFIPHMDGNASHLCDFRLANNSTSSVNLGVTIELYRNSTFIGAHFLNFSPGTSGGLSMVYSPPLPRFIDFSPTIGSNMYEVKAYALYGFPSILFGYVKAIAYQM